MAALAFAPSAQAASSHNVMLTKIPADVKSVELLDYNESGDYKKIRCFNVQSGKDKNTGHKVSAKHSLSAYMFGDSTCSWSFKGVKNSATVTKNLSTANFWFSLS